jgi:hypothetical protein
MPTLAALLGHSKLNMLTRYVHPQEEHQTNAVHRLAIANAAREISEFERKNKKETPPTISATLPENPANFSVEKTEGKSNPVN